MSSDPIADARREMDLAAEPETAKPAGVLRMKKARRPLGAPIALALALVASCAIPAAVQGFQGTQAAQDSAQAESCDVADDATDDTEGTSGSTSGDKYLSGGGQTTESFTAKSSGDKYLSGGGQTTDFFTAKSSGDKYLSGGGQTADSFTAESSSGKKTVDLPGGIFDTVKFTGLEKGTKYTITSELVDKEDGKTVAFHSDIKECR